MFYIILFYFTIVLLSGHYNIIYLLINDMLNNVYFYFYFMSVTLHPKIQINSHGGNEEQALPYRQEQKDNNIGHF